MNNKEIWKMIKDYENLYEVSNFGNVKSIDRTIKCKNGAVKFIKGKLLSFNYTKYDGSHKIRPTVELWKNNKVKRFFTGRLVAISFLPNKENKPTVNHKDGEPLNNNLSNLEWSTYSENQKHAFKNGLVKPTTKKVKGIKDDKILLFNSLTEAAKYMGVTKNAINAAIHKYGRSKKCKGFIWEYID
jgi:hypothetical protein